MSSSLTKKLGLKAGQRALVLNQPEGFAQLLDASAEGVVLETVPNGLYDFVLLFVKDSSELEQWVQQAIEAVNDKGRLWVSYPKKCSKVKSDLHRDILWAKMEPHGVVGVSLISMDDTWSSMRFKPAEQVKSVRSK